MSIQRLRVFGEKEAGRQTKRQEERINGVVFPVVSHSLPVVQVLPPVN